MMCHFTNRCVSCRKDALSRKGATLGSSLDDERLCLSSLYLHQKTSLFVDNVQKVAMVQPKAKDDVVSENLIIVGRSRS